MCTLPRAVLHCSLRNEQYITCWDSFLLLKGWAFYHAGTTKYYLCSRPAVNIYNQTSKWSASTLTWLQTWERDKASSFSQNIIVLAEKLGYRNKKHRTSNQVPTIRRSAVEVCHSQKPDTARIWSQDNKSEKLAGKKNTLTDYNIRHSKLQL